MRQIVILISLVLGSAGARADGLGAALEAELIAVKEAVLTDEAIETVSAIEAAYRGRDMRPFWVGEAGIRPVAHQIGQILRQADRDALDPDHYGAGKLGVMLDSAEAEDFAALEIALSLGLARYVADLGQGRTTPHVADPDLFLFRDEVDRAKTLSAAAATEDLAALIHRYRPQTPKYERLREALAGYRALAERGGWEPIPAGPLLRPGMTDPRVGLLRARLRLWGDLPARADRSEAGGDPHLYDDVLAIAVQQMQYRHGLLQDRVVGPRTLAELNASVEDRIEQLTVNLERRRWMPDDLGPRYIFVNLADYSLKVVEDDRIIHETRVIVGRPYHRTPVFSHEMTYLVLNPFWHVPPSIARNELLPKIQEDPGFLAANNYTLLSDWSENAYEVDPHTVDWSAVEPDRFGYKIRQEPGDNNALGRLKFMFPNRFNIYIHDTPAQSLFARARRSFSHGCIRVMDPELLAEIVLSGRPGWSLDRIERAVESGRRTVVSLPEPLPVHITYQTAWVEADGSVHFRHDIYSRDMVLAEALMGARQGRAF